MLLTTSIFIIINIYLLICIIGKFVSSVITKKNTDEVYTIMVILFSVFSGTIYYLSN